MKHDQAFADFMAYCCMADQDAVRFLVMMTDVAHFFDDVYDGDREIGKDGIGDALWKAMVAIPRNPFYRKHFEELQPLVAHAINQWQVANALEKNPASEIDLRVAFVVRSSYIDLIQQTAMICGGPDWAVTVGVEIRRHCHAEPWRDYLKSVEEHHGILQRAETTGPQPGDDRVGPSQRADSATADGNGPRAIRVVKTERGAGSGDADAHLPATTADR